MRCESQDDENPMTSSSRWTSNSLLGGGRLTGTLEQPVDGRDAWRSAMTSCGKLHPGSKRRKNTSCPEACLCNRKSLWALSWLTLVVTLAGTVLPNVELR